MQIEFSNWKFSFLNMAINVSGKIEPLQLSSDIKMLGNIYSTSYLESGNKRLSFNYSFKLPEIFQNVRPLSGDCTDPITINEISIFRFYASDTAQ